MRHREHAQPRLAEVHLRTLDHLAKRYGVSMTDLLNLIVATALEDLAQAPGLWDAGHTSNNTAHDGVQQRHPVRQRRPKHAGHTPSRIHDRHRLPRAVTTYQRHPRGTRHH